MDEIEELLDDAGERWRASQPLTTTIDPWSLISDSRHGSWRLLAPFAAGAAGAALVLAAVGVAAQLGVGPRFDEPSVGAASSEASASTPAVGDTACAVTKPEPAFVAPSPYPTTAPPLYESDWYGSEALWTMLHRDGEIWNRGAITLGVKTFWWSLEWQGMSDEPQPALSVAGTRLDAPGTFTAGPATNAARDDFGEAMLVGVEIPTAGCWQITGSYGDAVLSYVVSVTDD